MQSMCRFGYLPKGSAYDCFYYRLKLNPFEGDQAAEAVRQELLASFANDVRIVVCCALVLPLRTAGHGDHVEWFANSSV